MWKGMKNEIKSLIYKMNKLMSQFFFLAGGLSSELCNFHSSHFWQAGCEFVMRVRVFVENRLQLNLMGGRSKLCQPSDYLFNVAD